MLKYKMVADLLSVSVGCGSKTKGFFNLREELLKSANEQLSMIVTGSVQSPYNS